MYGTHTACCYIDDDIAVLTLVRTIKPVVTGQAPVTLERKNTPEGKTTSKRKVLHAYIIAEAIIHASAKKYTSYIKR